MSKKSSHQQQIVGYKYFLDFLMGICRGSVDELVALKVGDLPAWSGSQGSNGDIFIDKQDLFGGKTGEGGVWGTATFMLGEPGQNVSGGIKSTIAGGPQSSNEGNWTFQDGVGQSDEGATSEDIGDISDFRGVTTLYWSGQIASNNPYAKPWKARARRTFRGWDRTGCWYREKAVINYAPQITSGTVGVWDASANNPHLQSGVGYSGQTFNVSVAGGTNLDGITDWSVGDMASFNGAASKWEKITSGETIIKAMNPAHILYQCLTDRSWGRGMSPDELDNDAWVYAANYLFNESFGLCIRWSKDGDINDFIQTIIDHIGAAMYIDRGTGLMVLRLIRNDYNYNQLPIFGYSSGLLSVDTQETGASTILANEVVVKWHDPIRDQDRQTRVHNLASMQSLGYPISISRDFKGIPDPDLAQRVALRELQAGSAGVKRFKIRFDRRAWRIQPGMVMRIVAPDKGINDVVLRVATYDDGTMLDGTITMDCLQDVFGLPSTIYAPPIQNTTPETVIPIAPPVVTEFVQEASYLDMIRGLPSTAFSTVGDTEGGVLAMAGRPTSTSQYFALYTTPAGGIAGRDAGAYAPTATSGKALSYYDINVTVTNGTNLDALQIGTTGVFGNTELVRVSALTPGSGLIVLDRGGGDTVPVHHAAGEKIIFDDASLVAFSQAYESGEVITAQLQNVTSSAASDLRLATTHTLTIVGRHFLPYVMGDLRLNGIPALSDTPLGAFGNAVFTWNSRNRLLQSDQFVPHNGSSVSPEAGTTYVVEVRDSASDALIRTHSGISATSYTYDAVENAAGDPVKITFVFYTQRDGINSFSSYRVPVIYTDGSFEGVGQAAGHGTAQAVGSYFRSSRGSAAGVGTAQARGIMIGFATAVGNAAGLGSIIWPLTGLARGTGAAHGVSEVFGLVISVGNAAGRGAANAVSVSTGTLTSVGNAAGHGQAVGQIGDVIVVQAAGQADGLGIANGIQFVVPVPTGAASGTGTAHAAGELVPKGQASGVGAAHAEGAVMPVGFASGVGNAIGAGESIPRGVAAGVGVAHAIGTTVPRGVAAGIGAARAIGTTVPRGVAAGVGAAHGVVAVTYSSAGAASGTGVATGIVATTHVGDGTAAGVGAAIGAGALIGTASSVGAAAGVGAANGVGARTVMSVGAAAGVGAANANTGNVASADGVATGVGAANAVGIGLQTISGVGAASGVGVASGVGRSTVTRIGAADGAGTAVGDGVTITALSAVVLSSSRAGVGSVVVTTGTSLTTQVSDVGSVKE